jgi:hypothetical protein
VEEHVLCAVPIRNDLTFVYLLVASVSCGLHMASPASCHCQQPGVKDWEFEAALASGMGSVPFVFIRVQGWSGNVAGPMAWPLVRKLAWQQATSKLTAGAVQNPCLHT